MFHLHLLLGGADTKPPAGRPGPRIICGGPYILRTLHSATMPKVAGKAVVLSILTLTLVAAQDTKSPNEPILKPECDASIPVSIRYSSASSRLYLESADGSTRGGCVTLAQIWKERGGKAPLYAIDPQSGSTSDSATGTWLLTEELFVRDGITLQVNFSLLLHFVLV